MSTTTNTLHLTGRFVPAKEVPEGTEAVYWIARAEGADEDVTVYFKRSTRAAKMAFTRNRNADCIEQGWKVLEAHELSHGFFAW